MGHDKRRGLRARRPLPPMIPRAKRSPLTSFLVTIYKLGIFPIIALWTVLELVAGLLLGVLALPWTLHYYSSNHGLLYSDRKLTRRHAEHIQHTNNDVNAMMPYLTRRTAHSHAAVAFYPHDAEDSYCCFPGKGSFETAYSYPSLSKLFMALDEAGWTREVVYDLFAEMASDPEARQDITAVKRRACRGGILRRTGSVPPYHSQCLIAWTKPPPAMLKASTDQTVVEVDMSSAAWVLAGGAVLRPKNEQTLCALEKLNGQLDMWKFVTSEDNFREKGCWQYVVL